MCRLLKSEQGASLKTPHTGEERGILLQVLIPGVEVGPYCSGSRGMTKDMVYVVSGF